MQNRAYILRMNRWFTVTFLVTLVINWNVAEARIFDWLFRNPADCSLVLATPDLSALAPFIDGGDAWMDSSHKLFLKMKDWTHEQRIRTPLPELEAGVHAFLPLLKLIGKEQFKNTYYNLLDYQGKPLSEKPIRKVGNAVRFLTNDARERLKSKNVSLFWLNQWLIDVVVLVGHVEGSRTLRDERGYRYWAAQQKAHIREAIVKGATPFPTMGIVNFKHFRYWHYLVVPIGVLREAFSFVDGEKKDRTDFLRHDIESHLTNGLLYHARGWGWERLQPTDPNIRMSEEEHKRRLAFYIKHMDELDRFAKRISNLADQHVSEIDRPIFEVLLFESKHENGNFLTKVMSKKWFGKLPSYSWSGIENLMYTDVESMAKKLQDPNYYAGDMAPNFLKLSKQEAENYVERVAKLFEDLVTQAYNDTFP